MRRIQTAIAGVLLLGATVPASSVAAQESAAIAPDRLAAARKTIGHIFPAGTYARIMDRSMGPVMDSMLASVGEMQLRDLAGIGGKDPEDLKAMGDGTLKEMMALLDPHYEERMRTSMKVMSEQMTVMMARFEPAFQDGLARAYAKRFSVAQLAEMNTFFATPTGSAYAAESMVIMTDPEVMGQMRAIMPEMMKQMPGMMKAVQESTAHLPEPRKPSDLSGAEKEKLAALMGVPPESLGKSGWGMEQVD